MAEFTIKMADERGRVLEQVENGFSASDIRERYSQQGFLVYSIKPRRLVSSGLSLSTRRKVKLDTFVIFNSQFLTLIRAGLPVVNALDLLIKRQKNAQFRSLLENVRDRVKGGELLSDAFAAQGAFPKIYPTTLLAGEKSGNLEEVLSRYINFQRMAMTFRKKLKASLVYPALLTVMVTCMLIFLMTYVVPKFGELYSTISTEKQLPALTVFMLAVGQDAQKIGPFAAVVVAIAAVAFWRWKNSDSGSRILDRARMRTPVLGGIWQKYQVAVFSRMLGTLLTGGLPLVPSLETAGASMQSRSLADSIVDASHKVREGRPLSSSLEETARFPELSVEMIEVGESTGALPAMLNSVAEFYEEDVQTALTAAMSLIEPAILIVMGVIVAFVLLSLYLPIFTLGSSLH